MDITTWVIGHAMFYGALFVFMSWPGVRYGLTVTAIFTMIPDVNMWVAVVYGITVELVYRRLRRG